MKKLILWSLLCGALGFLHGQEAEMDSLIKEIYQLRTEQPEGFEKKVALDYCRLGSISLANGNSSRALDLFEHSLKYANGDNQVKGTVNLKLSHFYLQQENLEKAFLEAKNAEIAFVSANSAEGLVLAKGFQGLILFHQNHYEKAFPLLMNAIEESDEEIFLEPALSIALKLQQENDAWYILQRKHELRFPNSQLEQLRSNLSRKEAILGYFMGESETYAYLMTSESRELINLGSSLHLADLLRQYKRKYLERNDYSAFDQKGVRQDFFRLSSQLYKILWRPLDETGLLRKKELKIISDGLLNEFPFETLISDAEIRHFHQYDYVIQAHSIHYYGEPDSLSIAEQTELFRCYQHYLRKLGPKEKKAALRRAQLALIRSGSEFANPWYWVTDRLF